MFLLIHYLYLIDTIHPSKTEPGWDPNEGLIIKMKDSNTFVFETEVYLTIKPVVNACLSIMCQQQTCLQQLQYCSTCQEGLELPRADTIVSIDKHYSFDIVGLNTFLQHVLVNYRFTGWSDCVPYLPRSRVTKYLPYLPLEYQIS